MEDSYAPSKDNRTTNDDSNGSGAFGAAGDDDLMGAIGIDLESDLSNSDDVLLSDPEGIMESEAFDSSDLDSDDYGYLDPYTVGANVAAAVRQLVSQKIDRIITVAVEQAVAKELRRLQQKRD
ncbi:hypothetical protein [Desulfatibacillum aliphaticivorans]|uniref:Uncharacterized protein n=1 Tax=Desulfatibacillum aliphaticivorans TaxID=218208 RepID=B8FHB7_DESAL|nr:hypothetical protein [Desulfatibacillum aliphaticivorans]ACL02205.1 hypothetical protein Dalk_0498 [Desulfatibacillum aliphaticivorans]